MAKIQKTLLMILDGWGIGDGSKNDIIATAPTPFMDSVIEKYPHSQLMACGAGLPFILDFIFNNRPSYFL